MNGSLLLLDDEWQRYAKLNEGGKHRTILAAKEGPNAPWIRLSDDLGDHGDELLAEATEGDVQKALSQLTLWAPARALVIFGSGTKIGEVTFVGRLVGAPSQRRALQNPPAQIRPANDVQITVRILMTPH